MAICGFAQANWIVFISYSIEVFGPTKRALAGGMAHIYYGIGYVATSLIGFLCPDWRDFTMVIVLVLTFYFLLLPLFPESPAWQLSSRKFRVGRQNLDNFAVKTQSKLDHRLVDEIVQEISESKHDNVHSNLTIVDLFRHRNIRFFTIVIS